MSNRSKDTGGPAFPVTEAENQYRRTSEGMTLRDYFAAAAMQALVATERYRETRDTSMMPKISYAIADAMLEARKK